MSGDGCDGACLWECGPGGNLAALPGTVATSSGGGTTTQGPANMIDAYLEADCPAHPAHWVSASNSPTNGEWLQLEWTSAVTINRVAFDTMNALAPGCSTYSSGRALAGGDFQYWDGAAWVAIGSVTGNSDDWQYVFPAPVTTTRLRLFNAHNASAGGTQQSNPVIYDWAAYCQ